MNIWQLGWEFDPPAEPLQELPKLPAFFPLQHIKKNPSIQQTSTTQIQLYPHIELYHGRYPTQSNP
ncbi:hypothetical protein PCANC_20398 [Puccinia coronata f. sp. avenae]|uniref:Uncharacterized protein n=1 Tax=Puccinia coronata f. sp. avenae TaxID=200324 RepID=A0A2N5UET8_9BASI|nr:hypothetical protein PCANC_20398 [Puccinia coronata f. sp. avenae]